MPRHKCQKPQLFMIEDEGNSFDEELGAPEVEDEGHEPQFKISFQAMMGFSNPQTVRVANKVCN